MNALERITEILERARVAGGWDDENVAWSVLAELDLDDNGKPVDRATSEDSPSFNNHAPN